jgi:putative ABC transport system permease protein
MLRNFFKIACRNLLRNKFFSLVNIFGLAIGMAACWFIFEYVHFERSFDKMHVNANRIYRVPMAFDHYFSVNNGNAANYPLVGPMLKAEFPEVAAFARLGPPGVFGGTVSKMFSYTDGDGNSKRFFETDFFYADSAFLRMFNFPFIEGNPGTALADGNSVVVSASTARKYFGSEDPMGKTLCLDRQPLVVRGVFKDIPENSHVHFNLLVLLPSQWGYKNDDATSWYTYVLLAPGANPARVAAKLPAFVDKYLHKKLAAYNLGAAFFLQPLLDIHLHSTFAGEAETQGSARALYFLTILGVFILVIAWINYVNLSTAKSMERAREVGVRKVAGATRWQLAGQFMLESLLINGLAAVVMVLLVGATGAAFDGFVGKGVHRAFVSSGLLEEWGFWAVMAGIFIIASLQVGAYPSMVISAFKPVLVLKGRFQRSAKGVFLRQALVTFQFFLSILLIAGTLLVYRQLQFMRSQDPGYKLDQLLIVKAPAVTDSTFGARVQTFRTELSRESDVLGVTGTSEIPGQHMENDNGVRRIDQPKETMSFADFLIVDNNFIATYGVKLAAGENLPENEIGDWPKTMQSRVMINESLAQQLGYSSPAAAVHQYMYFHSWLGDVKSEIVGVVRDYQQQSLQKVHEPIMFYRAWFATPAFFAVNIDVHQLPRTLAHVRDVYNKVFTGNAYESFFLNDHFEKQYRADEKLGGLIELFAGLAIFVACMGLLGLSAYMIRLRVREIGIRKVLGASVSSLLILLSRDFVRLVGIAALIALPAVWFGADLWLRNYAAHIRVGWVILVVPALLLLVAALVTVGVQSVKAALNKPVDSLKTE